MNYFEFYPGDYMRDTSELTLAEHGAYLKLLGHYYSTERPLPADLSALCRICVAMTQAERQAVSKVADAYFPLHDDGLRHKDRCDEEIEKAQKRIEAAKANGNKGGRPAKKTQPVSQQKPTGFQSANPLGTPAKTQPGEALHAPRATINTSGTNVPDAEASEPAKPVDPIWDTGLAFLTRKGLDVKLARSYLGKFRKTIGDDFRAGAILADAESQDISDPIPWLVKAAAASAARSAKPSAADDFRGKTYAGTADDELPESLR